MKPRGKAKEMNVQTLRGQEAIEYKRTHPVAELNKRNDPVEEERFDIDLEYAEEVAREDAGLLYVELDVCGDDAENDPEETLTELEGDTLWSQD